jgi:hypothetical protein
MHNVVHVLAEPRRQARTLPLRCNAANRKDGRGGLGSVRDGDTHSAGQLARTHSVGLAPRVPSSAHTRGPGKTGCKRRKTNSKAQGSNWHRRRGAMKRRAPLRAPLGVASARGRLQPPGPRHWAPPAWGAAPFSTTVGFVLKAFVTLFKRAATEKEPGKEAQVCPRSFCGEQGLPRIFNSWVHRSLLETQLKNVIMKNQKLSFLQPRNSGLCCSKVLNAVRGFTGFFDACSSSHTHLEALPATGLGQAATCSRTASCRILRTLTA